MPQTARYNNEQVFGSAVVCSGQKYENLVKGPWCCVSSQPVVQHPDNRPAMGVSGRNLENQLFYPEIGSAPTTPLLADCHTIVYIAL